MPQTNQLAGPLDDQLTLKLQHQRIIVLGQEVDDPIANRLCAELLLLSAELRGRVNAAYRMISWGAIPLGAALGGLIATRAGAYAALVVGAIGVATASLWVACSAVPRLATIDIG